MIIALFALSIVMIVGGIASVIQGFPFVRLESGLAMTIAGATTASGGAVLLGIAVVALRLKGLQRAVAERGGFGSAVVPAADAATAERADMFAPEPPAEHPTPSPAPLRQRPSFAGLGAAAAGAGLGGLGGLSATRRGTEPTFEASPAPAVDEAEPLLPDLLPPPEAEWLPEAPEPVQEPAEEPVQEPAQPPEDEFSRDAPEPVAEPVAVASEAAALPEESSPETVAEPPSPANADEPETPPAEDTLEVVGTYASGGNTYVMFSNGSIEADTPRGRFTFSSLDELKVFVESGGESDTRGAA